MRVGAGVQNEILESLALGTPTGTLGLDCAATIVLEALAQRLG